MPDHRRVVGDALVLRRQAVEARADHRLQARRNRELGRLGAVERARRRRACARSPRGTAGCRPRCGRAASARLPGGSARPPSSSARSASLSSSSSADRKIVVRLSASTQKSGRSSSQLSPRGADHEDRRRRLSPRNSIRSNSVGSAQCRSSNTSTSGRRAASSSSTLRMPQWSSAWETSAAAYAPCVPGAPIRFASVAAIVRN